MDAGASHPQHWPAVAGRGLAGLVAASLFPLWTLIAAEREMQGEITLSRPDPRWQPVQVVDWQPNFQFFDRADHWLIDSDGHRFSLSVLTYLQQRQGKEMIYWSNAIAAEHDRLGQETIESAGLRFNRSLVRDRGQSRLVWWLYRMGPYTATRDETGKLLQLAALLRGEPSTALVALSLLCASPLCQHELADASLDVSAGRLLREYLQTPE
jgi:hypothetical protein